MPWLYPRPINPGRCIAVQMICNEKPGIHEHPTLTTVMEGFLLFSVSPLTLCVIWSRLFYNDLGSTTWLFLQSVVVYNSYHPCRSHNLIAGLQQNSISLWWWHHKPCSPTWLKFIRIKDLQFIFPHKDFHHNSLSLLYFLIR